MADGTVSNRTSNLVSICNVGSTACDLSIVPDDVGVVHLEPGERWTVRDSHSLNEIARLRAALQEHAECCTMSAHARASLFANSERPADETTVRQPCGPDDHLYAARAGSPIGDGVCIKCGAQEVK